MNEGKSTLYLMGTVIQIWVQHETPQLLLAEAEKQLIDYEKRFSANDPHSDLMKINKQAGKTPVTAQPDLYELIKIGKQQSLAANSFLNIAIGPLIQAWRIGFSDAAHPSAEKIKELLPLIHPEDILLNDAESTVFLKHPDMAIDLGALAKGYFADRIIQYFQQEGALAAFIDLGGNVLTYGEAPNHSDGYWRVGIQNPFLPRGNQAAIIKVKNQSVVTSGIYERKLEWQGKTYHHIFSSETGYPIQTDLASLTIVSELSLDGEIWTTRLYGRQAAEIIAYLSSLKKIQGLVITTDGRMAFTPGLNIEH
ncbi:FAD:protein FMN transferase [Erwinia sp. CPCC 100877]|nr:FAD:protein FMN transferase [Erwinia sp. CPCC 100877]